MTLARVLDVTESLVRLVGRVISWAVLLMTLIMFVIVVLRHFFNTGSIALQESVLYLHAAVFMLGLAWTLADDGHVRVDIFYQQRSSRGRAWTDLLGSLLLLLPMCAVLFLGSLSYVADAWSVAEGSREAGGLPYVYLLKTVIPVAIFLLGLQGMIMALRAWQQLRGEE